MEQLRMIHKMKELPEFTLADGFTLRMYQPGDEPAWTEICSYGLLNPDDLAEGWNKCVVAMDNLVPERDVYFICDQTGKAVATCAAFALSDTVCLLHMLGALPEARGRRLAASMTVYGLQKMAREMSAGEMMRLRSDDWRISAVRTYLQCGFQPVLFDAGMQERWAVICDKLDMHGVEMLDDDGNPTGIIL